MGVNSFGVQTAVMDEFSCLLNYCKPVYEYSHCCTYRSSILPKCTRTHRPHDLKNFFAVRVVLCYHTNAYQYYLLLLYYFVVLGSGVSK